MTRTLYERFEEVTTELLEARAQIEELKKEKEQLEEQVWDLTHSEEEIHTNNH